MLDFRIGSRKVAENLPFAKKSTTPSFNLPNVRASTSGTQAHFAGTRPVTSKEKEADDDLPYVYTPNKMPRQKQVFYQLCDLHDAEIQKLISANDGKVGVWSARGRLWSVVVGVWSVCSR